MAEETTNVCQNHMIPQASNIGDNLIKIKWLYLFLFSFYGNTLQGWGNGNV